MPVLTTTTVAAQDVKVGDLLGQGTVAAVDAKVKWVTINVDGGKARRLERGTLVTVQRVEATAEEQAASELKAKLQWFDFSSRRAQTALAEAQAKVVESIAKGYPLGHWDTEALATAQTTVQLWNQVDHISRVSCRDGMTRLEALELVKEQIREELLQTSFASRSTSLMSNAFDAVELQAKAHFLRCW